MHLSAEQAAELQTQFLEAYPGIAQWQERVRGEMPAVVRTASGRFRYFRAQDEAYEERRSHGINGTIADGMKKALVLLHGEPRFRELGGRIRLVLDDELLVETSAEHTEEVSEIVTAYMVEGMSAFVKVAPVVVESMMRESAEQAVGNALPADQRSSAEKRRQERPPYDAVVDMRSELQVEALESRCRK